MPSSWRMGRTAKASGTAMPRVDRSERVVSSGRHRNSTSGKPQSSWAGPPPALWAACGAAPSGARERNEHTDSGNRPLQTLFCVFFFWRGLQKPVAFVVGPASFLFSCVGEVGGTTARKGTASARRAARQPPTKATAPTPATGFCRVPQVSECWPSLEKVSQAMRSS